jgi:hypothetical protein
MARVHGAEMKRRSSHELSGLEGHNAQHADKPFLLGAQLFQVFQSLALRSATISRMPVLNQTDAEVRDHLEKASAKCADLAKLLRKGPRPQFAVAMPMPGDDLFMLTPFAPIQPAVKSEGLDVLLDRAAVALDLMARQISRAKQHRNRSKEPKAAMRLELRLHAASVLAQTFRKKLGEPCHSHVAAIVGLMSNTPTDADYVKKAEKRRKGQKPCKF